MVEEVHAARYAAAVALLAFAVAVGARRLLPPVLVLLVRRGHPCGVRRVGPSDLHRLDLRVEEVGALRWVVGTVADGVVVCAVPVMVDCAPSVAAILKVQEPHIVCANRDSVRADRSTDCTSETHTLDRPVSSESKTSKALPAPDSCAGCASSDQTLPDAVSCRVVVGPVHPNLLARAERVVRLDELCLAEQVLLACHRVRVDPLGLRVGPLRTGQRVRPRRR